MNIAQLIVIIGLGILKFSILLFYRRIFHSTWFRRASLAALGLITAWTVAFFFGTLFMCDGRPYDVIWKSLTTYKEYCWRYKYLWLGHCATDVATDILVLSLPLPQIWRLQMSVQRKIIVSAVFLVGLLYVSDWAPRVRFTPLTT